MIGVNKRLTAVRAGGAEPLGGRDAPAPGRALFGLPQAFGDGASGGVGDFVSRNAGMLGGGALAGGLAGVLLNSKHARKYAGTALQVGAAAVLGGLAYKAFQAYRAGRPILPQGLQDAIKGMLPPGEGGGAADAPGTAPRPVRELADRTADRTATLLLRAMIASAMADGRIDESERRRLVDRVEASALSQEERHYLEALIARPDQPTALAADVASPEEAAQVYLAAFIAIDADTPAERAWLDDLAEKLALDPPLRSRLDAAGQGALGQAA